MFFFRLKLKFVVGFSEIIKLLDDHGVSTDGIAVYEVAYQVSSDVVLYSFLLRDINIYITFLAFSLWKEKNLISS